MIDIREKLTQLEDYFKKEEDIIAVYLFGSYASGSQTDLSDIDFAILFNKDVDIDLMREMEIMAQISIMIKKDWENQKLVLSLLRY